MIKINDNDIMRGGEKIGWFEGSHVFDHTGRKLGYFEDGHVFDHAGRKLARIEGNHIKRISGPDIRIDDNRLHVVGGSISDLERAAIRLLLGD